MPDQTNVDVLSDVACELGESALWDGVAVAALLGRHHRTTDLRAGLADRRRPVAGGAGPGRQRGAAGQRRPGRRPAARGRVLDVDRGHGRDRPRRWRRTWPATGSTTARSTRRGRFWFGSMDLAEASPTGSFYSLQRRHRRSPGRSAASSAPTGRRGARTGGPCTTSTRPGGSSRRTTSTPTAGVVGPGRVFVSDEADPWFPDGVTVDAEGYVWNCKWAGGRIVRYAPDGDGRPGRPAAGAAADPVRLRRGRPVACWRSPAPASAWTPAELADAPLSGQVLLLDPDARGLPTPVFAG